MIRAKQHHEQIKVENALSDMSLELTEEYANLWVLGVKWGVAQTSLDGIEQVIKMTAKQEWGPDTNCEFDYEQAKVHVTNGKRGKTFEEATNAEV